MQRKWLFLPGVAIFLTVFAGCGGTAGEVDATDDIIVRTVVEADYKARCKIHADMRSSAGSTALPGMGAMPDACNTATVKSISLLGTAPRRAAKVLWNTPGGFNPTTTEYFSLEGEEYSFTTMLSDESSYLNTK